jgi:hypothetical protein
MNMQKKQRRVIARLSALALILVLVFAFAACKSNDSAAPADDGATSAESADDTTAPADDTSNDASAEGEDQSGLPNPVASSTVDEIKSQLGFEFQAPDEYASNATYSIIDGNIAQMEYTMDSGKGPISVIYRVTRSETDNSLELSGDSNSYANTETVKVGDDQEVTILSNSDTGPALAHWHNKNVVDGSVSASLSMNPIIEATEVEDVAGFFVGQESKGF